MIQKNRSFRSTLLAALLCGTATVSLLAQGPGGPPPGGGPGEHHHGPPPNPLFDALDTNHDGVISADEMANATASLKSLLKDGATQLTREDLRPAHAPRPEANGDPAAAGDAGQHPRPKGVRPHGPPAQEQADADVPEPGDAPHGPHPDAAGNRPPHHGPPPSPLFDALDANHDGTISADEMGNATASLKSLLKDGATQLRREDLRPAHPPQHREE